MPILKPETADANELPCIVRYDLEPPPQGASRKQQVVGPYEQTVMARLRQEAPRQ
jgi:hypothetical protein